MKLARRPHMDRPAMYRITVQGELGQGWSEWFNGMTITPGVGPDGLPVTNLSGTVPDQAALHGLLAKIRDIGLTLLSVNRLDIRNSG